LIGVNPRQDNGDVTKALQVCSLLAALLVLPAALAQQGQKPNGVFLVAKPGLRDANFSETVVLVTQTEDASTVGVILNRPTTLSLRQFVPESAMPDNYREPVFFGGPVMRQTIVALFRTETPPSAPAFHVLKDLYLTMHPDTIRLLLADGSRQYRLYAGFAGWAPRQLESEFEREGWYVLPADPATVFRSDLEILWQELLQRAQTRPVGATAAIREHQ
jgi:putative transcriptional regulator